MAPQRRYQNITCSDLFFEHNIPVHVVLRPRQRFGHLVEVVLQLVHTLLHLVDSSRYKTFRPHVATVHKFAFRDTPPFLEIHNLF